MNSLSWECKLKRSLLTRAHLVWIYVTTVHSISNEKHVFTCLSTLRSGTV